MKSLIAITTLNNNELTNNFLESIYPFTNYDIAIFDDYSCRDNVKSLCKTWDINYFGTSAPKGLTYLWKGIYKKFKIDNYDICYICNNDVVGTLSAFNQISALLESGYPLCVPMSSKCGAGSNRKYQDIDLYINNIDKKYAFLQENRGNHKQYYPKYTKNIQEYTLSKHLPPIFIPTFLGFLFGFSKNIISCEFNNSKLFNPINACINQEYDLLNRMQFKKLYPVLCRTSYFYHYKRGTYPKNNRENLIDNHNYSNKCLKCNT